VRQPTKDHAADIRPEVPYTFPMAANQSERQKRTAILRMTLAELSSFCLTVDCLTPQCKGERTYGIGEIAGVYGERQTMADALQKMRCSCGARPAAAWLDFWPPARKTRRISLIGRDG